MSYQAEPYCYAVHTGQIITPMLEFVHAVQSSPWAEQLAADGESFADKADRYLVAAQESVAFHEFEWDDDGFYRFPADLGSLPSPGGAQPLNQSNALGRAHILLAAITGDPEQLAKATALATYFRAQIDTGGDGAYLWNYRGGAYANVGEDISHAAINVEFAVMAAEHGIVFDQDDVAAFARTFTRRVYVNDATFADHVGGGETNTSSYRAQIGRWLMLAPSSPTVYAAVRDVYERDYPAASLGSGSVLLGWALLAEHEPKLCAPFFYAADWDDQGDVREATAYAANIQTIPHALDATCLVPVEHDAPRATVVEQWDGEAYHPVASWTASGAAVTKHVPYDPSWPFVYASDGVLFQFEDAFTAGSGIVVHEPAVLTPPSITSTWPSSIAPDVALDHVPSASGDEPRWWTLVDGPSDARIDPASGVVTWTAPSEGSHAFVVRLDNRVGSDELAFELAVEVPSADSTDDDGGSEHGGDSGSEGAVDSSDAGGESSSSGESTGAGPGERGEAEGCACGVDTPSG
ncbi:MAG: hypothetical protein IAG13_04375, partial [Deltaproteobacteria bacterium]|nr:hypothetical protein [Nannocystaceae bacterium]